MANFDNIIQEINTNLPDNNTQSITAAKLRTTLIDLTGAIETEQTDFETTVNTSIEDMVIDNLTSSDTNKALSANQGRLLNDMNFGKILNALEGYPKTNFYMSDTLVETSSNNWTYSKFSVAKDNFVIAWGRNPGNSRFKLIFSKTVDGVEQVVNIVNSKVGSLSNGNIAAIVPDAEYMYVNSYTNECVVHIISNTNFNYGSSIDTLNSQVSTINGQITTINNTLNNLDVDMTGFYEPTMVGNIENAGISHSTKEYSANAQLRMRKYNVVAGQMFLINCMTSSSSFDNIAFYSGSTIEAVSYVAKYSVQATTSKENKYYAFIIPDGVSLMCITTHRDGESTYKIKCSNAYKSISDYVDVDSAVEEAVDEAISQIPNKFTPDYIPVTNPLEAIKETGGVVPTFHRIASMGGSTSAGWVQNSVNSNMYDYAYIACIGRVCNSDYENFGVGGMSAYSWLTNTGVGAKSTKWANDTARNLYIVQFGANDQHIPNTDPTYTLGSISDASNYIGQEWNCPNTFYGKMAQVIATIKKKDPRCKIFIVNYSSGYKESQTFNVMNAARELPSIYSNVFGIDVNTYGKTIQWYKDNTGWEGNHPVAAGYQIFAYELMTYIDWIVKKNNKKFYDTALIGTEYDLNGNILPSGDLACYQVSGTITHNGDNVSDAQITFVGSNPSKDYYANEFYCTSDSSGNYSIGHMPADTYTVRIHTSTLDYNSTLTIAGNTTNNNYSI